MSAVSMMKGNAQKCVIIRQASINTADMCDPCDVCLSLLSQSGGRSMQCTCSIQQVGDDFEAVTLVYKELLPLSAIVHLLSVLGHQGVEESIVLLSSGSSCTSHGPSNTDPTRYDFFSSPECTLCIRHHVHHRSVTSKSR